MSMPAFNEDPTGAPQKPPAASLATIPIKSRAGVSKKPGDLTHRPPEQKPAAAEEAPPWPEIRGDAPVPATPMIESAPASVELRVEQIAPEPATPEPLSAIADAPIPETAEDAPAAVELPAPAFEPLAPAFEALDLEAPLPEPSRESIVEEPVFDAPPAPISEPAPLLDEPEFFESKSLIERAAEEIAIESPPSPVAPPSMPAEESFRAAWLALSQPLPPRPSAELFSPPPSDPEPQPEEPTADAIGPASLSPWPQPPAPPMTRSQEPAPEPVPVPVIAVADIPSPLLPAPTSLVLAEPAPVPAPVPQAETALEPLAPAPPADAAEMRDLLDYWRQRRGTRAYPSATDLDRDAIAQRWPDTWLLDFKAAGDQQGEPALARVTRLGAPGGASEAALEYSTYITEWILELGRAALDRGVCAEEIERLATQSGAVSCRVRALPLGPAGCDPDYVLCELARTESAPRFGRRRTWLSD